MIQKLQTPTTPHRLLDAAEALLADQGVDATSLRQITAAAEANLAAVNYHFGSKEALVDAVLRRRIEPLNAERLSRLEAVEADDDPLDLEAVLEAWLVPALQLRDAADGHGDRFVRLIGRVYSEPGPHLRELLPQLFGEVFERFSRALGRALPGLPRRELVWRMHFLLGSMIHTLADPARIETFSGGLCNPSDTDALAARLLAFVAAGMRAPLPAGALDDEKASS